MYNLTNVTESAGLFDFVVEINNVGHGAYMVYMMLIVFVIMFVTFRINGNLEGLLTASYLTSIIAMFLFWGGFISIMILLIPIVLTGVFGLIKINQGN